MFFTMENRLCGYYALGGAITNVFHVVNALDGHFASTQSVGCEVFCVLQRKWTFHTVSNYLVHT